MRVILRDDPQDVEVKLAGRTRNELLVDERIDIYLVYHQRGEEFPP